MAAQYGYMFTPLQIGRNKSVSAYYGGTKWNRLTLPDITIWSYPGQHHEIKHKSPTRYNQFGLEEYRLKSLVKFARATCQDVMYTIHNHAMSGGRDTVENQIQHWLTANVLELIMHIDGKYPGFSWVDGKRKEVLIFYWNISRFYPLLEYWKNTTAQMAA